MTRDTVAAAATMRSVALHQVCLVRYIRMHPADMEWSRNYRRCGVRHRLPQLLRDLGLR